MDLRRMNVGNVAGKDGMFPVAGSAVMSRTEDAGKSQRHVGAKVVDLHVHVLGAGEGEPATGCRTSKEFLYSPTFAAMLVSLKTAPFEASDRRIREILLQTINTSEHVDCAVLLAMDGVYKNGKHVDSESHLVVPNDYVIDIVGENRRTLFGASVHPYRLADEMVAETRHCVDKGAALFTWSPSAQQINPEDDRCIPLYIHLGKEGIPLLCHAGTEFTMRTSDFRIRSYNDPRRLIRALDIGVKVIVAHSASPSAGSIVSSDRGYFNELIQMLRDAEAKRWELYADISAFCTPSTIGYLERIVREIEEEKISPKRFLYGSDFPMPAVDINLFRRPLNSHEFLDHIKGQGNLLDNHYRIMKQFGIHEAIFTNACDVLRM